MGDLTVSALCQTSQTTLKTITSVGFSYAMDALTVGYTTIKPGSDGPSATSGTLLLNTQLAHWLHLSHLTKQTRLQSLSDYALGGGASAFAAMHDKPDTASDLTTVGLNFAF